MVWVGVKEDGFVVRNQLSVSVRIVARMTNVELCLFFSG